MLEYVPVKEKIICTLKRTRTGCIKPLITFLIIVLYLKVIKYKTRGSYWLMMLLIIVNFYKFFIQPAPDIIALTPGST